MSAALSRLRALLSDELFVRGLGGLQPTPRALDLAESLGRALADIQRTFGFTQRFDPRTSAATFTLGLSEHPAFVAPPPLAERLRDAAPGVVLRVRSVIARDDAVAFRDAGEVHLAVGVLPTLAAGRILIRPLFEERFVCVVRRGHPATSAPLDLPAFLSLSHLLVSPENERYGHVDVALARRRLKRRLALTLPQMYAAPAMVPRPDLIATLTAGVVDASAHADGLVRLQPPLDLDPVPFVLMWHRRTTATPHSAGCATRSPACRDRRGRQPRLGRHLPQRERPWARHRNGRSGRRFSPVIGEAAEGSAPDPPRPVFPDAVKREW